MAGESGIRIFHPLPIHFNEAIAVACVGLAVNITSALLLKDHHDPSMERIAIMGTSIPMI